MSIKSKNAHIGACKSYSDDRTTVPFDGDNSTASWLFCTAAFPDDGRVKPEPSNYWKNLCMDYKEVATETAENAWQKPIKAMFICSGLGFIAYCAHKNPDEWTFRDKFLFHSNEMTLIGESVRNPRAVSHLRFLEMCYNMGVMRTLSLGIINFVWISDYDKSSGLYQAHCNYLEPKFSNFHERIVDIGFLGEWWILQRTMKDFDVNPSEFENLQDA